MEKTLLQKMISFAKDRVRDDLFDLCANGEQDSNNRDMEHTIHILLSMPDNLPETLAALSISYWNGVDDTFWEWNETPPPGTFIGFNINSGKWKE